jgi:hypothetical protein
MPGEENIRTRIAIVVGIQPAKSSSDCHIRVHEESSGHKRFLHCVTLRPPHFRILVPTRRRDHVCAMARGCRSHSAWLDATSWQGLHSEITELQTDLEKSNQRVPRAGGEGRQHLGGGHERANDRETLRSCHSLGVWGSDSAKRDYPRSSHSTGICKTEYTTCKHWKAYFGQFIVQEENVKESVCLNTRFWEWSYQ